MNHEIEIKKWLLDHHLTQAGIARDANVSRSLVCMVLKGKRKNPTVLDVLKRHAFPLDWIEQHNSKAA